MSHEASAMRSSVRTKRQDNPSRFFATEAEARAWGHFVLGQTLRRVLCRARDRAMPLGRQEVARKMNDTLLIGIISGVAVALALAVASRRGQKLEPRIREELSAAGGVLLLPELVTRIGLKDSFINRGKVIQAIAPMIQRGEVTEEDDPNATVKTRLDLKKFRLKASGG